MSPDPDGVLDQRILGELRRLGREPGRLLEEMAREFLIEAPSLVAEIERAVIQEAYLAVASAAHRLKGASGHMGASRLAAIAAEVETSARATALDAMASAMETARSELDLALAGARGLLF